MLATEINNREIILNHVKAHVCVCKKYNFFSIGGTVALCNFFFRTLSIFTMTMFLVP